MVLKWQLFLTLFCVFQIFAQGKRFGFVGWNGEGKEEEHKGTADTKPKERQKFHRIEADSNPQLKMNEQQTIEILSWNPRIFTYSNFLSADECQKLKKEASLFDASVLYTDAAGNPQRPVRDYEISKHTPLTKDIDHRISDWVQISARNGEPLHIHKSLHNKSEQIKFSSDYLKHTEGSLNGGKRIVNVYIFLNDVKNGGEFIFPQVAPPHYEDKKALSHCAKLNGLAIRAQQGTAVAIWNLNNNGTFNENSLHGFCPIDKRQESWVAVKWLHTSYFDQKKHLILLDKKADNKYDSLNQTHETFELLKQAVHR